MKTHKIKGRQIRNNTLPALMLAMAQNGPSTYKVDMVKRDFNTFKLTFALASARKARGLPWRAQKAAIILNYNEAADVYTFTIDGVDAETFCH